MTLPISPASNFQLPLDSWVTGEHLAVPMKHFELTYRDGDDNNNNNQQTKTINSFGFVSEPVRESAVVWLAQEMTRRGLKAEQIVTMNERMMG